MATMGGLHGTGGRWIYESQSRIQVATWVSVKAPFGNCFHANKLTSMPQGGFAAAVQLPGIPQGGFGGRNATARGIRCCSVTARDAAKGVPVAAMQPPWMPQPKRWNYSASESRLFLLARKKWPKIKAKCAGSWQKISRNL